MCRRTHWCIHLRLLLHLVGELKASLRRQVLHLRLERVVAGSEMLGRRDHAHVYILLMCSLNLLLLLLEKLDLLLDGQLLHCEEMG